jgi:hypothetical protein
MRQVFLLCASALLVSSILGGALLSQEPTKMSEASPIYGVSIPDGYPGWEALSSAF